MNATPRPRPALGNEVRPEDEQAIVFAAHVTKAFPNGDRSVILSNGHRMMVLPAEGCAARAEPGDLVRIELTPQERVGWRLAPRVRSERSA